MGSLDILFCPTSGQSRMFLCSKYFYQKYAIYSLQSILDSAEKYKMYNTVYSQ